jgi:hypothetical protein
MSPPSGDTQQPFAPVESDGEKLPSLLDPVLVLLDLFALSLVALRESFLVLSLPVEDTPAPEVFPISSSSVEDSASLSVLRVSALSLVEWKRERKRERTVGSWLRNFSTKGQKGQRE